VDKRQVEKLTEIDKLYSARLVYDNGELYLQISYLKNILPSTSCNTYKHASIDIGINNLASIFIDDETTPSLLIDGKPFKSYNSKFNRLVAKLSEARSKEVLEWAETKSGSKYPIKYTEKGKEIGKFISFLYSKRNRFFHDQFHKLAKRIVEYLYFHSVTDLFISKNLAELKNNGECNLNKSTKQNFIQIPFIKLLKNIEYKAQEYGIQVHYIDERYTSKASCISDDIKSIQESPDLTNAFNGKRVKRGLFLDTVINKVFNADVNGAVNHIKVATGKSFEWLKNKLFKLSNPIKIKSDYEFCRLIKNLWNSVSGKSVPFIGTEASQSNRLIENISFC
jgi:IS605 OrfB family transposase